MTSLADLPDYLKLNASWVSQQQLSMIENYFGSLTEALAQSEQAWANSDILNPNQLNKLFSDELPAEVELAIEWGQQDEQGWIMLGDQAYPERLRQISAPPILLGYRGDKSLLADPQLAIVGSRHASKAGKETAKDFGHFVSSQGITITSGLALGIDTAAHQGGLLGVGKTIAVVATGLDRIYPASNKKLGQEIVDQGVMISEFSLGAKPLSYHFPRRNRIISGLSLGTLVVEAALKSGSLITAKTAMEQGREVFAVPGSIHNPQAKGCHELIKSGAKLVESGQDILEELLPLLKDDLDRLAPDVSNPKKSDGQNTILTPNLSFDFSPSTQKGHGPQKSADKNALINHLSFDPISLDELVVMTKKPVSVLQSELMLLELSGKIESLSAARWRRLK